MFYPRQEKSPSLLKYLFMFIVAAGLALFFLITDSAYDRAGVMGAAALLAGSFLVWQILQFDDVGAVKEEITQRLRDVWS
jgi:hypothetical protein